MRVFSGFIYLFVIVALGSCKPTQSTTTTVIKDSTVYKQTIDTVKEYIIGDSLLIETVLYCDSLNQIQQLVIDSLSDKLKIKIEIKGNKLSVKIKQKDYYKISLFYKALSEMYRDRITTKTEVRIVKERVNYNLYAVIGVLTLMIILLIRYKK
jgi:hypothetical protein